MLRVHPPVLNFCLFTRPTWRDGRCTTIPESGTSSQRLVLTPCLAFLFGESRACAEVSLWSVALTHGSNEPSRLAALQCDRRARLWQEVQILPWSTEIVALTCGTRKRLRPVVPAQARQACCATPVQNQKVGQLPPLSSFIFLTLRDAGSQDGH